MAGDQTPRASVSLPDVRESTSHCLTGHRSIARRPDRLSAHHDCDGAGDAELFDMALERRVVDQPLAHEINNDGPVGRDLIKG